MAVDNIAEKIIKMSKNTRVVRIGHPARILDSVLPKCLDQLFKDYKTRFENLQDEQTEKDEKIKKMTDEEIKQEILDTSQIIFSTNVSSGGKYINKLVRNASRKAFDLVIIDECAQATEPICWIPLKHAEKVVLAGDHMQLAPLIKSKLAADQGLSDTMFEQLIRNRPEQVKMLRIQHRMNEKIMFWSSECMYKGELVAAPDVADQLLGNRYRTPRDR